LSVREEERQGMLKRSARKAEPRDSATWSLPKLID